MKIAKIIQKTVVTAQKTMPFRLIFGVRQNCCNFASDMQYNTFTLPNGLRIIHLPSASNVVFCGYEINAGTRHERNGEEGMAHFCEHATFKGTGRRRALQVINCLESVGGDLNAFTTKEETVYYAAILKDHVGRAVDLLTDIVMHSVYPQQEIEKEVDVICDEIESYNDSPAELIYDEFENLLFAGHPLGHNILGTPHRLRTYTGTDLRAFARRHYLPQNAVFFAYGDLDFRRLVALLRKATADMPCAEPLADTSAAAAPLPDCVPCEVCSERATHQSHVMIGCRAYGAHDERRMPLYLLNNILGGPGMNARLNLSLRERHGLVYTVESTMVSYSDTGLWSIYFGCDRHDTDKCLRLVRRELDRMMERPLSDTQLKTAKKQLKGQIAVACDNRESFALDFAKGYLHYGRKKNIEKLFEDIDALTADELCTVAQRLFAPENLTTLIFR